MQALAFIVSDGVGVFSAGLVVYAAKNQTQTEFLRLLFTNFESFPLFRPLLFIFVPQSFGGCFGFTFGCHLPVDDTVVVLPCGDSSDCVYACFGLRNSSYGECV